MKKHRVRTADPIDGKPVRHLFVEITSDSWLEVNRNVLDHGELHDLIDRCFVGNTRPMLIDSRAFHIGIIKDWREELPLIE